jgi:hypothetical protein
VLIRFAFARHIDDTTAFAHGMTALIDTCHSLIDSLLIIGLALLRRHHGEIGPYRGYNSNGPFLLVTAMEEHFLCRLLDADGSADGPSGSE